MNEVESVKSTVSAQFSRTAENYAQSAVHSAGDDLELMVRAAAPLGHESLLDVGTGAGPVLRAFSGKVASLTGLDFAEPMLERAAAVAPEARLVKGDAESLPFPDASFDIVTCRVCAHHFPDFARAIREAARVLRPGGLYLLDDNYAPEDPALGAFLNGFEQTRDPGHVAERPLSEWRRLFESAGLTFEVVLETKKTLDFEWWINMARTPPDAVARLREQFAVASLAARAAFGIHDAPLRFDLPWAIAIGRK
ncbi:MAG TPA: methyltransferase domain-containing protein [Armatimonadota bacterium]